MSVWGGNRRQVTHNSWRHVSPNNPHVVHWVTKTWPVWMSLTGLSTSMASAVDRKIMKSAASVKMVCSWWKRWTSETNSWTYTRWQWCFCQLGWRWRWTRQWSSHRQWLASSVLNMCMKHILIVQNGYPSHPSNKCYHPKNDSSQLYHAQHRV